MHVTGGYARIPNSSTAPPAMLVGSRVPTPFPRAHLNMLANLARAAARPSLGLVRRAAATAKCPTATATAVSVPRNLRCASTLSEVLKAEIEEERLVSFDEGEGCEARSGRLYVCILRSRCCVAFLDSIQIYGWFRRSPTRVAVDLESFQKQRL